MIKRLFRTWLRYMLYKSIGEPTNYKQIFEWIYDSPIWEWNLRIFCIRSSKETKSGWINENCYGTIEEIYSIEDAETLLRFFHK